jgi:hypothetical protein
MTSSSSQTNVETSFDSFNIHTTPYKKIGDYEIEVSILIPKELKPGKHPLIVKWHGGGLVSYVPLTPSFFSINPSIRILPHSTIRLTISGYGHRRLRTMVLSLLVSLHYPQQRNRHLAQLPPHTRTQWS